MADSAQNLFKNLAPVDAQGLVLNRPGPQTLWSVLTNVFLNNGFIETRPAFRPVGPTSQDIASNGPGVPTVITQAPQYVGETQVCELLLPDSTISTGTWTALVGPSLHDDIDEDPPDDGTTLVNSGTDTDEFEIGFANLTITPDVIDSVLLHVRARAPNDAQRASLLIKDTNDLPIGEIILTNGEYIGEFGTVEGFVDYFFSIPFDINGDRWSVAEVNAEQLKFQLSLEAFPALDIIGPDTTGSDDDFTPAGDAWKDTTGTIQRDFPIAFFGDQESVKRGSAGARLSIDFLTTVTGLTTISQLKPRFMVGQVQDGAGPARISIYHKGTDTVRRTLASGVQVFGVSPNDASKWLPFTGYDIVEVTSAINPETSAAWTVAEIVAGIEFGIEVEAGSNSVEFTTAEILIEGPLPSQGADIDRIALRVCGRDLDSPATGSSLQEFLGRLMSTDNSFMLLEKQRPSQGGDLVDQLGALPNPTAPPYLWNVAEFFDRVYFANGVDIPYFWPDVTGTMGQLSAGTPIGRSVWNFGQRLMQGDVTDTGVRSIKRIAWSGIAAPDDWTASDAGDLDLTHGGEGRIQRGFPLSSHIAAIYLDKGIYNLRWTGDDSAPFIPRLQDPDTGLVAPNSLQAVLDKQGLATHFFLGRGPQGLNIFAYDGTQAQAVGEEIDDELRRLANQNYIEYAFAAIEPTKNLYLLFVPEGDQLYPEQCWVYHLDSGHWTRWEFPYAITSAGQWTLLENQVVAGAGGDDRDGRKQLVVGASNGIPYRFDFDNSSDFINAPGPDTDDFFKSNSGNPAREFPIEWEYTTGDLVFGPEDIVNLTTIKRVWITYEDRGFVDVKMDISNDGGLTFGNDVTQQLGEQAGGQIPTDSLAGIRETVFDVPLPTAARHHRVRFVGNNTEDEARQKIKISKLVFEYEIMGDMP